MLPAHSEDGKEKETPVGVEPTSSRVAAGRLAVGRQRQECPRQESNLACGLRGAECLHHTPRTEEHPGTDLNRVPSLRRA